MNFKKMVGICPIPTKNKKNNSNYYNICDLKYLKLIKRGDYY